MPFVMVVWSVAMRSGRERAKMEVLLGWNRPEFIRPEWQTTDAFRRCRERASAIFRRVTLPYIECKCAPLPALRVYLWEK